MFPAFWSCFVLFCFVSASNGNVNNMKDSIIVGCVEEGLLDVDFVGLGVNSA